MEHAGRPRHRLHNPRGEGESAGGDRINPSVGGSDRCQDSGVIRYWLFVIGLTADL
jgi:hypothetical protein